MEPDLKGLQLRFSQRTQKLNLTPKYDDAEWLAKQVRNRKLTQSQVDIIPLLKEAAEIAYPGKWDIQFKYELRIETGIAKSCSYGYSTFDTERFNATLTSNALTEEGLYEVVPGYVLGNFYRKSFEDREYTYIKSMKILITYVQLIIHFPEVTITNTNRQSHNIKDLFIALQFNGMGQVSMDILGTRSTYSELEVIGNYVHSHLPSMDFKKEDGPLSYTKFCKGSSGAIISCLSFYNATKDLGNLLSILYHLNTTANHESIEGGPHYRMEDLQAKEGLAKAPDLSNKEAVWHGIRNGLPTDALVLDWKYSNGNYTIVDNDKLNDFCVAYTKLSRVGKEWLVMKSSNGNYYKATTSLTFNRSNYPEYANFVPFRGQKYVFSVYKQQGPVIADKKVFMHPLIKDYVKSKLESYAAKAAFKSSAIEYLDSLGNN